MNSRYISIIVSRKTKEKPTSSVHTPRVAKLWSLNLWFQIICQLFSTAIKNPLRGLIYKIGVRLFPTADDHWEQLICPPEIQICTHAYMCTHPGASHSWELLSIFLLVHVYLKCRNQYSCHFHGHCGHAPLVNIWNCLLSLLQVEFSFRIVNICPFSICLIVFSTVLWVFFCYDFTVTMLFLRVVVKPCLVFLNAWCRWCILEMNRKPWVTVWLSWMLRSQYFVLDQKHT